MSKSLIAVSALVGATTAFVVCLGFFYFVYKPHPAVDAKPLQPTTPVAEIPNPEIKVEDVRSVGINTVYTGYFQPGDKCARTYNEYFGNEDGFGSRSSPCTMRIFFGSDGHATRSVEIGRWDKAAKEKQVVDRTESTATISTEQFNTLAQIIVTNEAFKAWREGTMVTVSNCSITVDHAAGTKTIMSNVDEKATTFLPMVRAFQSLETRISWTSVR